MELVVETAEMQRVVRLLGVVAKSNTKDSTGRVLIEALEDGAVSFVANDRVKNILITPRKVLVKTPGVASLVFSDIKSFINSFKPWNGESGAKEFRIVADARHIMIYVENVHDEAKTSKGHLKLDKYDVYDIRKPRPFGDVDFTLSTGLYKKALNKIMYAINPSQQYESLRGMNINFDKDNIYFVGSDGLKLSEYQVKNNSNLKEGSIRLSYDFITALRRCLSEETDLFFSVPDGRTIGVKFTDKTYDAAVDVVLNSTLLISGDYPIYRDKFDKFDATVILDKHILMDNLFPFLDVLNSDDNCRLTFSIKEGKLEFNSDSASFKYGDEIDFAGEFVADFNGRFFIQTVEVVDDEKIAVKFKEGSHDNTILIFDSSNFSDQKSILSSVTRRR